MIDPFSRILLVDDKGLRSFASAQETIERDKKAEKILFNEDGPDDPRYRPLLHELAEAYQTAGDHSMAAETALVYERMSTHRTEESRIENFHLLGESLIAMRKVIEAQDLLTPLYQSTMIPIIGWWTRYWNLHFLSLLADVALLKGEPLEEEAIRYRCADGFAKEFGMDLTVTMTARMKLGECQQRKGDFTRALLHYQAAYAHFHGRKLFSTDEESISLLARIYACEKHLNEKERMEETRAWLMAQVHRSSLPSGASRRIIDYLSEC